MKPQTALAGFGAMAVCRILYFRGGILEDSQDRAPDDVVEAARQASSRHPHLTAEIWRDRKKVAVVRPCCAYGARVRGRERPPPARHGKS